MPVHFDRFRLLNLPEINKQVIRNESDRMLRLVTNEPAMIEVPPGTEADVPDAPSILIEIEGETPG